MHWCFIYYQWNFCGSTLILTWLGNSCTTPSRSAKCNYIALRLLKKTSRQYKFNIWCYIQNCTTSSYLIKTCLLFTCFSALVYGSHTRDETKPPQQYSYSIPFLLILCVFGYRAWEASLQIPISACTKTGLQSRGRAEARHQMLRGLCAYRTERGLCKSAPKTG